VEDVRRRDEEDFGEIIIDVEVMILESGVLLGVEDFKQRGSRIATEIVGHLVDFVEEEDWIARAGLLHRLDDLARQSSDIGAAVAANFSFVADSA
jgi:hypothetical protein